MPFDWQDSPGRAQLTVWPHRSLPRRGFVWFIGITAGLLALPMLALVGTRILWGLLPFAVLTIAGLWFGISRTYRSGQTHEVLTITRDSLTLTRRDPGRPAREWRANPYWVRVAVRHDGPVDEYLTLTDGRKEVELAAFLTPDERRALHDQLQRRLFDLR
ncbi:DUF2244 domain-containing protein [Paracoccus sp. (in: a-proteobacteria)]|uniref:DUF2244 domain-containing protein n=1 Tax=Paracoccus sp. TaxID=267 RepID=UPI0026DF3FAD|nr:DUF2244 domain-containing protein [Paracoccus sp. (in: a-proteobacteria)]MDO5646548.1 DUF2244 domain-containing protein [Paracoccus sp. (in: a-proteobacteria)]